jgi:hypothetical protein
VCWSKMYTHLLWLVAAYQGNMRLPVCALVCQHAECGDDVLRDHDRGSAGRVSFSAGLITTLSIVHDVIMRAASSVGQRLSVELTPSSAALQRSVAAVWPRLQEQRACKARAATLDALVVSGRRDTGWWWWWWWWWWLCAQIK